MFKKQLLSQKAFEAELGSIYASRTSHVTEVSRCLTRGSKDLKLVRDWSMRTPLRQSFWRSCGCSRSTNVIMVWAWMLWSPHALGTRTELWFGHGCSGERMLSKHER